MNINTNIINRNIKITEHLDHILTMWREGRMPTDQAKMLYRFIVKNITFVGHHDLFEDEFVDHIVEEKSAVKMKRSPRKFTDEDIETLKTLYVRGRSYREIGKALNRTEGVIQQVVFRLQTQKVLPKRYQRKASANNININNNNEGK